MGDMRDAPAEIKVLQALWRKTRARLLSKFAELVYVTGSKRRSVRTAEIIGGFLNAV
jgi:hypothetical protein